MTRSTIGLGMVIGALGIGTACSSHWSQEESVHVLLLSTADRDDWARIEVRLDRLDDTELPCDELTYTVEATFDGDASGVGVLQASTELEGELEEVALDLPADPTSITVLESGRLRHGATRCSASIWMSVVSTAEVYASMALRVVVADSSSSPADDPGPTRLEVTVVQE